MLEFYAKYQEKIVRLSYDGLVPSYEYASKLANKYFYLGFLNKTIEIYTIYQPEGERDISICAKAYKIRSGYYYKHLKKKNLDKALESLDQALEDINLYINLKPNDPYGYLIRTNIFIWKYGFDEIKYHNNIKHLILEDLTICLRLHPNPVWHQMKGELYINCGNYDDAITEYTSAIEMKLKSDKHLNDGKDNYYSDRANAYYKKGELIGGDEALQYFKLAWMDYRRHVMYSSSDSVIDHSVKEKLKQIVSSKIIIEWTEEWLKDQKCKGIGFELFESIKSNYLKSKSQDISHEEKMLFLNRAIDLCDIAKPALNYEYELYCNVYELKSELCYNAENYEEAWSYVIKAQCLIGFDNDLCKARIHKLHAKIGKKVQDSNYVINYLTSALEYGEKLPEYKETCAGMYCERAELYIEQENYDMAFYDLSNAITISDNKFLYYGIRGNAYELVADKEKAKNNIERANNFYKLAWMDYQKRINHASKKDWYNYSMLFKRFEKKIPKKILNRWK